MKQLLIEVDEDLVQRLDRVAPARSRRRSEFVRAAIRKALWELEETLTARAYAAQPDSASDAYLDALAWEKTSRIPATRARRARHSPARPRAK
jgi:Arc/MetJ family transcription regulator